MLIEMLSLPLIQLTTRRFLVEETVAIPTGGASVKGARGGLFWWGEGYLEGAMHADESSVRVDRGGGEGCEEGGVGLLTGAEHQEVAKELATACGADTLPA